MKPKSPGSGPRDLFPTFRMERPKPECRRIVCPASARALRVRRAPCCGGCGVGTGSALSGVALGGGMPGCRGPRGMRNARYGFSFCSSSPWLHWEDAQMVSLSCTGTGEELLLSFCRSAAEMPRESPSDFCLKEG